MGACGDRPRGRIDDPIHAHPHRMLGKAIEGVLEELPFSRGGEGDWWSSCPREVLGHEELVEIDGLATLHVVRAHGGAPTIDPRCVTRERKAGPALQAAEPVDMATLVLGARLAVLEEIDDRTRSMAARAHRPVASARRACPSLQLSEKKEHGGHGRWPRKGKVPHRTSPREHRHIAMRSPRDTRQPNPSRDLIGSPCGRTRPPRGRYEVGPAIGSGGFATVFRALDRQANVDVAVKLVPAGFDAAQLAEHLRVEAAVAHAIELASPGACLRARRPTSRACGSSAS